ncbi:hypothetical protein Tco_1336781 [Tanacetum coccineum]
MSMRESASGDRRQRKESSQIRKKKKSSTLSTNKRNTDRIISLDELILNKRNASKKRDELTRQSQCYAIAEKEIARKVVGVHTQFMEITPRRLIASREKRPTPDPSEFIGEDAKL